ncbi:MAG: MaoC/PaaZ C-terminal domain-containing protein [Gemmobacter sp.]|nr:MaoC/PaaZ C-terminal domain-containing protein [Gemmobacter sp.]
MADHLMSVTIPARDVPYGDRETILYALACGADADDLPFVYESNQRVVPSFVQMLGFDDNWLEVARVPLDLVVHGSLDIRFAAPVPSAATVTVETDIVGLTDKGAGRGGIVHQRMQVLHEGQLVSDSLSSLFVRGAGGFGGSRGQDSEAISCPDRAPDHQFSVPTAANQAALFRLLGDRNPLHIDPDFARAAGFPAPILHGAATFGTICLALLKRFAAGDPARLTRFAARFTGPVFPGDLLRLSVWEEPDGLRFRAHADGRDKPVLDGGLAVLSAE